MMSEDDRSIIPNGLQGMSGYTDAYDFSDQGLSELPILAKPSVIVRLDLSSNILKSVPDMSDFSFLRTLNLSHNQLVDVGNLASLRSLRELDISHNRIVSIGFVSALSSLEILKASHNRIATVAAQMPDSLIDCNLSFNELSTVEFLQHKFPTTLERLDFSSNMIDQVMELRYLAVFTNLSVVRSGLLQKNRDLMMIPYVKHICPSIKVFDGEDCPDDVPCESFPNEDDLFEVLMSGDEQTLCQMLTKPSQDLVWEPPAFVAYEEDEAGSEEVQRLERQIMDLEAEARARPPPEPEPEPEPSRVTRPQKIDSAKIREMKTEVAEIKAQLEVLLKMLFVHDQAVQELLLQKNFQ